MPAPPASRPPASRSPSGRRSCSRSWPAPPRRRSCGCSGPPSRARAPGPRTRAPTAGLAATLEERARVAAQHEVDVRLADPALPERRDDVVQDVEEVPVRRDLLLKAGREPVAEAVRVL